MDKEGSEYIDEKSLAKGLTNKIFTKKLNP